MRKFFNKALAAFTSVALVATLLVGINVTTAVKADDQTVELNYWTFTRGGVDYNSEYANGNEGRINSVTMNGTNEVLNGWKTLSPAEETKTATQISTGFNIDIANTGWDKDWTNDLINPWQIQAQMNDVAIEAGHTYTVTFKARASKKKYAYVSFGCTVDGTSMTPYDADTPTGSNQIIAITTAEQTYTYTFTNWVSAKAFSTVLMLGDFNAQKDYAGNDVSDIITETETGWAGNVYVSDFTITDKGLNDSFEVPPERETQEVTTAAPTTTKVPTTTKAPVTNKKLAKVTNVKAKNNKKGTIKITWKKVANAKKYQIKVNKKTYSTTKVKLTVKKLKKGKTYKVKVRATATGYTTGAWSKPAKVKIKK
jgi:hypothetical protein